VYARLGELNRETGLAMVVVEQAAELALEIASRAYVLTSGRTSAGREGAAMRDADFLRSSYLGS
jgi:branched-chain amino acid transport system ATP-binding protein